METNSDQECCGSGCTNCVLDLKPSRHKLPPGVTNLFDRTYQPFVCCSIVQQAENVFRFTFRRDKSSHDPSNNHRLIVPPGCHLLMRAPKTFNRSEYPADDQLVLWRKQHPAHQVVDRVPTSELEKYDKNEEDLFFSRPYTPIAHNHEAATFEVLIKMEPGGKMTEYLLTLSIGSTTEWKGVYGEFQRRRNQYPNVVGFVQGVAIAPVYSTMRSILDDDEDYTRLTLCACFRDLENVLLRDELQAMAGYWNFKYETYLSRRSCSCLQDEASSCSCIAKRKKYNEPIYDRRLDEKDIARLMAPSSEKKNSSPLVLLCGTDSFTSFIISNLVKLGIENFYIF
ncbi:NADH-cytochrome b5 reductase-like [Anopheles ziemanni]|uniref:NADH-cytochrome b5 reductase-like n=1 Tax=Anopheles coustani TaxID=139045 RepID=UPI00265AC1FA|nr:NADH-cytochrome b5 reductase-like [Anopheles coustani]XP_058174463.1 NADH-cytochrome b5 reductase-like [Anopheles ziemanni]